MEQFLPLIGAVILGIALVLVVRWRARDFVANREQFAHENVCEHLKPALDLIVSRGGQISRVGQKNPEYPLEIHITPPFDPKAVYEELKLAEPVFLSDRNVLYCKEDFCEIDPRP